MRSRRNQFILLAAVALALNALFNHIGSNESSLNETLKSGDLFPPYEAKDQRGETVSNGRFADTPVVYFFFANWCPCSHESVQWVQKALAEYGEQGLAVVGVGIQDQPPRLLQFVKLHKIDFPVVTDGAGEGIAGKSGVKITPTTIFVDRSGVVRSIHVGKIETWEQMKEGVERAVAPSSSVGGVS